MICLNMIVRNEADRILRALDSVRPYISTFAILDTGSTDGTDQIIKDWGERNGINGIIAHGAFVDFSQARNQALDLARTWHGNPTADVPAFEYLLLCDADMELVVDDPNAFAGLSGEMYEMVQKGGAVAYQNPRLLSVRSGAYYVGATHEYLAAPPTACAQGAFFIDHADGSNRKDKFERDIRLLMDDLSRDPNNPRSWFYLGNSYRDSNRPTEAISAYMRRLEIGGWDEEDFITRCNIACCYKDMGDTANFVWWCLMAFEKRPCRAESLYDMAHYFREKGENQLATAFAEAGIGIPRPSDKLFVNDFVYSHGFREEFSIAGWYTDRREKAFKINNGLALDRAAPEYLRQQARTNMVHYLRPLKEFCPSVYFTQIGFQPRAGFVGMNPSITQRPNGKLECLLRTVNYRIDEHGRYMIGELGCGDAPIITENWLLQLSDDLAVTEHDVVAWERPAAKFYLVIGLEDMRLFWHDNQRMFNACVREQSETGQCEQWQGRLVRKLVETRAVVEVARRISDGQSTEKNWSVIPLGRDEVTYMYRLGVTQDEHGYGKVMTGGALATENISGSSQWITFNGGYLSIVHEAICHPGTGKRVYQHRFAFYDGTLSFLKLSLPFVFNEVQIEFCAGLAWHPDRRDLVASFGVRDCEAWLATVHSSDVMSMLGL